MSPWVPYLALTILPLLAVFPFNLLAFAWGFHHGTEPMPPDLALRSKKIDRYGLWLRETLLLLAILCLTIHYSVPFWRIGLHLDGWRQNLGIGIGASVLQISLQTLVLKVLPPVKGFLGDKRLPEGAIAHELALNVLSVLAQELWIAFCIVALKQANHSNVISLVLTGGAFGAAHFQYRRGAVATGLYGVAFGSLFLWRRSLLPSFLVHYVGNMSAHFWAQRSLRQASGAGAPP